MASLLSVAILTHVAISYRSYNVILITVDTQRPDYFSCYNPEAASTPNIDFIASKGIRFTRAFSLIPITMPAHTAIFTSHYPHQVKVFNNGDRFHHNVPMFTDIMEEHGYTTGGFISLGVLSSTFGLAQGFDQYDDDFSKMNGRSYKIASEVNEVAVPWIEKNKDKKFFAWIHYSDPHEPYIPADAPPDTEILVNGESNTKFCIAKKEKVSILFTAKPGENRIDFRAIALADDPASAELPRFIDRNVSVTPTQGVELLFDERWESTRLRTGAEVHIFEEHASVNLVNKSTVPQAVQIRFSGGIWDRRANVVRHNYSTEVQYVDTYVGLLWKRLEELKLLHKTIVIITADHGEGLKTHGIFGHVDKLWNETTHIPLIVYYPWLGHQGKVEETLTNQLDIMPTILNLAHVRTEKPMEGRSLKYYLSRSPIDWMITRPLKRKWTFASTYYPEAAHNSYSITDGFTKIIHTPTKRNWAWEAYDMKVDPLEKKNIARLDPKRFRSQAQIRALLEEYRKDCEVAHTNRESPALSEEEAEMLRALGYVTGDDENDSK